MEILHAIRVFIAVLLLYAGGSCFTHTLWHLLYESQLSILASNRRWTPYITGSLSSEQDIFWLKYRRTLGNPKFTSTRIAIPIFFITVLLVFSCRFISNTLFMEAWGVVIGSITICGIAIWTKLPKGYYDEIKIKQETTITVSILGVTTLFAVFCIGLRFVVPESFDWLIYLAFVTVCVISAGLVSYYTTIWVISAQSHPLFSANLRVKLTPRASRERRVGLINILRYSETYNEFMQHLIKEFSIENLLAVTEMVQFESYYASHLPEPSVVSRDRAGSLGAVMEVYLPLKDPKFPKSGIVYGSEDLSIDDKICMLIEKYVLTGAHFEVNISYALRQEFEYYFNTETVLGNMSLESKVSMFDGIIRELLELMDDSFCRYKRLEEFRKSARFVASHDSNTCQASIN